MWEIEQLKIQRNFAGKNKNSKFDFEALHIKSFNIN